MNSWSVQDAKARFSELLETCLNEGPQLVTRRGTYAAVLVPVRDWQELQRMARPALKDLLLDRGERHGSQPDDRRPQCTGFQPL